MQSGCEQGTGAGPALGSFSRGSALGSFREESSAEAALGGSGADDSSAAASGGEQTVGSVNGNQHAARGAR